MWNTDVFHRKVHIHKLWDTGNELISVLIFRPGQTLKFKSLPSPILIESFLGLTGSLLEFLNTVFHVLVFGAESLYLFSRRLKCMLRIFVLFWQKLLAFTKLSRFHDEFSKSTAALVKSFHDCVKFPRQFIHILLGGHSRRCASHFHSHY